MSYMDPDGSPCQQVFLHRCVPVSSCLCSDCTPVGMRRKTSSGGDPPVCL